MNCQTCGRDQCVTCQWPLCGKHFANKRALSGHVNAHRGPVQRRKNRNGHVVDFDKEGVPIHADDCAVCVVDDPKKLNTVVKEVAGWIA